MAVRLATLGVLIGAFVLGGTAYGTFSGRDGLIFFCQGQRDLFTVRPDGSHKHRVAREGCFPSLSADGRMVVFSGRHLSVMNANGSGRRAIRVFKDVCNPKLGCVRKEIEAWWPSFSPDGNRIVFSDAAGGGIWAVDVDGSHPAQLTHGADEGPVYAPNGKAIMFSANGRFTLMNPDGSNRRLIPNAKGIEGSFSPGGGEIVFAAKGGIYQMKLDGSRRRRLTRAPAGGEDLSPQFSPNGQFIVFERLNQRTTDDMLMLMRANGSQLHQLVQGKLLRGRSASSPAWQPLPG